MKFLLFLSLLSPLSILAQDISSGAQAEVCYSQAYKYYIENSGPSDESQTFNFQFMLKANEELTNDRAEVIAKFDQDHLIYHATGSYYSGYFIDLIAVEPKTCQVSAIINLYSE